jgi:hypothetical protein
MILLFKAKNYEIVWNQGGDMLHQKYVSY